MSHLVVVLGGLVQQSGLLSCFICSRISAQSLVTALLPSPFPALQEARLSSFTPKSEVRAMQLMQAMRSSPLSSSRLKEYDQKDLIYIRK